ncbi:hypothetical protein PFICI_06819 [Pestalotiopsis fici W106-1]|uniref:Uncharacterized protein n=1 Tax=Pestalotiopsis fici (strain W106-1 / CGMCC3.15140) TaxID=1229662 RepID=W3X8V1_PESFW|nr:uncharacterized protein PFICI_06819 [Pestalotiopsis fici W106-1]ETS81817.1 hypothetical protein PFICI_06819 [Pestalotiopsis fici W106-1]
MAATRRTPAQVQAQLPVAVFRLRQENDYNAATWPTAVAGYEDLLADADFYRKEEDPIFDTALTDIFNEAKMLLEVHERYCARVKGPYRFTTMRTPRLTFPTRMAPYTRDLPDPCCDEKPRPPPTYTSLVPRPDQVMDPPFQPQLMSFKRGLDWKYFFKRKEAQEMYGDYRNFSVHADLWAKEPNTKEKRWRETHPWLQRNGNSKGINLAQFENKIYERLMQQSIPANLKFGHDIQALPLQDDKRFAVERGLRRVLIQKVLAIMDNSENREIGSAWRRVVLPKKPEKFKDIHFSAMALPRREKWNDDTHTFDVDRHKEYEPSPWVYWYNQWREQADYLSAWSRKQYQKRYWKDFKRIHLPVNYRGPYTFDDKNVWDKHWLAVGKKLVALKAVLEKLEQTNSRQMLTWCLADMRAGEAGEPLSDEVIPRPNIDLVTGRDDKFQLVDDTDISWLKIFCLPPTSKALCGLSVTQPEDPLIIILDNRLQALMTDVHNNPFWVADHRKGDERPTYRPRQIALEHLLPMINLGGKEVASRQWEKDLVTVFHTPPKFELNGAPLPNALYQFSLKELKVYCSQLAEMGRISYKRPENPVGFKDGQWWSGKGMLYGYPDPNFASAGGFIVSVPPGVDAHDNFNVESSSDSEGNPLRYAEERIRWRHRDQAAVDAANAKNSEEYANVMMARNRAAIHTDQLPYQTWRNRYIVERFWKQGPEFPATSVQARRDCPSWEDLCDYKTVVNRDTGYSTKTTQFLRNLAYRMGRTLRSYRDLVKRTSRQSALKRTHCNTALREWKKHVEKLWLDPAAANGAFIPIKLASANTVIAKADEQHPAAGSKNATEIFEVIRGGIIEDMVQDRVMLYPSRRTVFTDKHSQMFEFFERANIWSFGKEEVRERHAPYRRKRYFDMQRWPVSKQTKETTRTTIIERRDEDPSIQPVASFFKYGIKVGPTEMVPANSDVVSRLVGLISDPDKSNVAGQLVRYLSKEIVKIVETTDNFGPGWQIYVAPPGTSVQPSSKTISGGAVMPGAAFKPIARIKQQFIPGPAVFPMGDTLLQQVKISQELEKILDPTYQRSNRLGDIIGHMADWITPPPKRVSLLPDMDLTKTPSSVGLDLKRKVPTAFMASDGRVPKRQIIHGGTIARGAITAGDSGDSESDADDVEWEDADNILPSHLRSDGNEIVRTSRKKNGTWRIRLVPDLEDVMRLDVWGRMARGAKMTTGNFYITGKTSALGGGASRPVTKPLSAAAQARLDAARADFNAIFPRGYAMLPTSGNRLLCALYAIIGSIQAQYPAETAPTIAELYDHFQHPRDSMIQTQRTITGLTNMNELGSDQAASTLLDWALARGRVYQLGVYAPATSMSHVLLGIPASHGTPTGTVWIQNNAQQAGIDALIAAENAVIAKKKGASLTIAEIQAVWGSAGSSNHYSALRPN